MKEKMFEQFFGVNTWSDANHQLFEPTDYEILMKIFEDIYISPDDTIVDFGCGKGRVLFYCNNRFFCNVTGIEADRGIYDELIDNAENYHNKFMEQREKFRLYNLSAEEYEIDSNDKFFYFFNPFSSEILEKILAKIIRSTHENLRQITLIFYYCTYEHQSVIRKFPLRLEQIIKLDGYEEDPDEKVCIYRL